MSNSFNNKYNKSRYKNPKTITITIAIIIKSKNETDKWFVNTLNYILIYWFMYIS